MCGIVGLMRMGEAPACREQLSAMIAMVKHRGPDAMEVYLDGHVGLAHARLSIIDLQNGRQPMQTPDGGLAITFNGEIFNYVELREQLQSRGCQFRTHSDTEVILHAYAEYGERCVEEFNGQWAFAIWDRRRQRLFLSRDRLGIRPLYYTSAAKNFLFASEIKALFAHPAVARSLDRQGVSQLLSYWSPLPPHTLFQDVYELPAAHNLVLERGQEAQIRSYWQLDYDPAPSLRSVDELSETLRELLTDATRLRLRADVPVGAYLSGGLDSSITATLAQQFSGSRLKTFSVTFTDDEFDEREHQRTVHESLNVDHQSLQCTYDDIAQVFPDVVWHAEKAMFRTAPAPLQLLASQVHTAGYKVVLTGEGADELLGGYDIFKEAKVRRFCARQPESELRMALFQRLYPYLPNLQRQSVAMRRAFFQAYPGDLADPLFSHLPRWRMSRQLGRMLSPDFRHGSDTADEFADVRAWLPDEFASWQPFCQAQFLETKLLMPGYILSSQGDRMAMAHSVEGRFPFLDHRVAEFAARLNPRLKMRGLNEKYLLKHAFRRMVPDSIIGRTKQPYRAPDAKSFFCGAKRRPRADYVADLLSPARVLDAGVFHPPAVAGLLKKIQSGRELGTRDNMALVAVLSTQLLVDQFIDHFPSCQPSVGASSATSNEYCHSPNVVTS